MKLSISIFTPLLIAITFGWTQEDVSYPSLPSRVLSTYTPQPPPECTPETMAASANTFLAELTDKLRKQANLDYDSPEKAIGPTFHPEGFRAVCD